MNDQSIARRYAKAIFELAVESNSLEAVAADLTLAREVFESTPEFTSQLNAPSTDRAQRRALIEKLLAVAPFGEMLSNALRLLAERHRMGLLDDIVESFAKQVDAYEGRLHGKIVSALPLEAQDISEIAGRLERALRCQIVMDAATDPELLGGLLVEVDGKTIDGSVRGQLNSLSRQLRSS